MSSSSAPSTATTSSLSRAESLTTMEYLQGAHPLSHGYPHRHFSSAGGSGSTTTGSSTGNSFGHQSVASSSVSGSSNGGARSLRHPSHLHHHSSALALGRANLNAAIHHHQQRPPQGSAKTRGSVADAVGNGKPGSSTTGTAEQQARNSTKRAAQNRAAQRAFRQRKDLYVRDLERKAEMLQQAEGKIMALTARNRELEVALAASQSSTSSSPQQSPLHSQQSPNMTLGVSATAPAPPGASSSSSTVLDREQGHEPLGHERERLLQSRDQESSHENTPPSTRPTLGRHASAQQLHYTYTSSALSSSPPQSNGSSKYSTANPSLPQQAMRRSESDFELERHEYNAHPHRHLHRHPSEPSLKYRQRESNSTDSGDDYETARGESMHGARSGSIDSGMQTSQHPQPSSSSSTHPFKQHQASPSSELPPLHPITTSTGKSTTLVTSGGYSNSPSVRSWSHPQDESAASHSPMGSSTSHAASSVRGGMVTAVPSPSRSHGTIPLQNADMEYVSDDRSESGSGCGMVQKRPSDGAISWSGSSVSGNPDSQSPPHGYHLGQSGDRKSSSWNSYSSSKDGSGSTAPINLPPLSSFTAQREMSMNGADMEMQDSHQNAAYFPHYNSHSSHAHAQHRHHPRLQHRASVNSLSGKDDDRRPSGSEASGGQSRMMKTESPDMSPSDTRFHSNGSTQSNHSNHSSSSATTAITAQMTRHQQQYFSSLQVQHQQIAQAQHQQRSPAPHPLHPQTPEHEYPPPGVFTGSSQSQQGRPQQYRDKYTRDQHHHLQHHVNSSTGSEMDAIYDQPRRSSAGYHDEASMGSP
ncbi:hypothetical protein BGZ51_005210 [Haplosporangium sp. Z 767]|nr:hypothetical protein BGZ51_005210 [Haplosporangium sp. Z 767]